MYNTLDELLEIELNGERGKCSFHVRHNFERFHNEFPFLHDTIGVGSAIEKILSESKDESMIKHAIEKIGDSHEQRFTKRNYILILADLYLEYDNEDGLENIIFNYLKDEFKFHGYRKLLIYYSKHYDEKKFLETFKNIAKRNTLMPVDRDAINKFIETYSFKCKDLDKVKDLVRKKKIYPKINQYIIPMLVGYFGSRDDFQLIESIVFDEMDDENECYSYTEIIYNELYKRSNEIEYRLKLLAVLEDLCDRIPKELKVIGYPSKLWTLFLWRVGCKYLDLDKKEKVEQIIKKLTGKNKDSLKGMYEEKYKNN